MLQTLVPQTIPVGVTNVVFQATDADDNTSSCNADLTVEQPVGTEGILWATGLLGIHPNPFNPRTTVRFHLERAQTVRLSVFDVRGRQVEVLHDGALGSGVHELTWDGSDAASGVYVVRLTTAEGEFSNRAALLK